MSRRTKARIIAATVISSLAAASVAFAASGGDGKVVAGLLAGVVVCLIVACFL